MTNEAQKPLTWKPDEKVEITGYEFESFIKPLELFERPMASISLVEQTTIFTRLVEAARSVLERMQNEGKISQEEAPVE